MNMGTEYIFDARIIIEFLEKEGSKLDRNAKRDLYLIEKVVNEKDPKRKELLEIFLEWMTDGNEKSIMPELLDSDRQLKDIEHEIFNIFREDDWKPEDFVTRFLPELAVTYSKYFKIFFHPLIQYSVDGTIRFNRIICPVGFKDRFFELINQYDLYDHRHIIFHLIAEIIEYEKERITALFEENGIINLKKIRNELNLLEMLKYQLHSKPRLAYKIHEIDILFNRGKPIHFKTHWVISHYILDRIFMDSRNIKYANKPRNLKQFNLPHQNDYSSHFQDLLIKSLYEFLVTESKFQFDGKKLPRKLVDFFISFFNLCDLPLLKESEKTIKSQDKRFEKVERKIQRAIKNRSF